METEDRYKPAAWTVVLLAALPGLLVTFSRVNTGRLGDVLAIVGYLYLGLLLFAVPLLWGRKRKFPVWALLPAGAVAWFLTYLAGAGLAQQSGGLAIYGAAGVDAFVWIGLFNLMITLAICAWAVFGAKAAEQRPPVSFWLILGGLLLINLLVAILIAIPYARKANWIPGVISALASPGMGLLESLMLVAVGFLAARQHERLALLVIIGGYSYMCSDSDFLYGYWLRDWAGYIPYLIILTGLYLIVTPVALLRASTRLGRALAVFLPVGIFQIARIAVPHLVSPSLNGIPWSDVGLSLNVLLSLALGWVLYGDRS